MFVPWVGERFGSEGPLASRRLLILGESHHAEEHEVGAVVPEMTRDVFKQYRRGPWTRWMRTLDNVAAAVTGRSKRLLGPDGVRTFWDQVAFYNYVPVVAAPYARQAPTPEHVALGAPFFDQLLEELQPGAVIVCGYRLWPTITASHVDGYADNPWRPSTPFAAIGKSGIPALRMAHPSTGFSPSAWHPLINDLIGRAAAAGTV